MQITVMRNNMSHRLKIAAFGTNRLVWFGPIFIMLGGFSWRIWGTR
jgi:hypothetical protein